MASHGNDLRSAVGSEAAAHAVQEDYRSAGLDKAEVALLDYGVKLTQTPSSMGEKDVESLRLHGFSDEQIVDAVHCIAYFNFVNRVLDGLGVAPESFMKYAHNT